MYIVITEVTQINMNKVKCMVLEDNTIFSVGRIKNTVGQFLLVGSLISCNNNQSAWHYLCFVVGELLIQLRVLLNALYRVCACVACTIL